MDGEIRLPLRPISGAFCDIAAKPTRSETRTNRPRSRGNEGHTRIDAGSSLASRQKMWRRPNGRLPQLFSAPRPAHPATFGDFRRRSLRRRDGASRLCHRRLASSRRGLRGGTKRPAGQRECADRRRRCCGSQSWSGVDLSQRPASACRCSRGLVARTLHRRSAWYARPRSRWRIAGRVVRTEHGGSSKHSAPTCTFEIQRVTSIGARAFE
jgi:hypothetical protein